ALVTITLARPSYAQPQAKTSMVPLDELLLFFPAKFPQGDWQLAGESFEDVSFQAEDGTKLHGWYCPCENPRGVLLLAHGNAGNIATRIEWIRYLQHKA